MYSSSTARPILIARPAKLETDSVKFVNGDSLTGTIESIAGQDFFIRLDSLGDALRFPTGNLSSLSFVGPPNPVRERSDVIYLRDGGSLTARVTGLGPEALQVTTFPGQQIAIPKRHLMGLGFHTLNGVLFDNDFSPGKDLGFVPVMGTWNVEKGQLVQTAPKPFCRAYLPLVQSGMVRYEWTTDASQAHNAGLLFCAARYDTRFGQLAYLVMLKNRMVYLYKVVAERRHQAWRERVKSSDSRVRLAVEYDPRTGEIVVRSDEEPLIRLVDPDPIRHGEYVILHTEGKAAYDDIRVTHLVGAAHDWIPEGDLDTLLLSNGDRVSGKVVQISDQILLQNAYASPETPIDRAAVRSIVFANPGGDDLIEEPNLPQVTLWNGDTILAQVLSLDEDKITLKPCFTERLVLARSHLREIVFPEEHAAASTQDASADGARGASEGGRIDLTDFTLADQEGE
jgi:hypothetical protein